MPRAQRPVGRRGRCTRARSCRTRTCSISTPRCGSRSSSPSRPRSSSSTRIRAAWRPAVTIAEAYVRAREADPLSAFGGIVGLNRALDVEPRRAITSTFIEAVIAPSVADDARDDPGEEAEHARGDRRLRCAADAAERRRLRPRRGRCAAFLGGVLTRSAIGSTEAREPWPPPSPPESGAAAVDKAANIRVVTKRQPTAEEWTALRFAWRVCAHVKSNAVDLHRRGSHAGGRRRADEPRRCGEGRGDEGGRRIAARERRGVGRVLPVPRRARRGRRRGRHAVVQPGGSVRDAEVIAAADERGLAMVFTGRRHFRH